MKTLTKASFAIIAITQLVIYVLASPETVEEEKAVARELKKRADNASKAYATICYEFCKQPEKRTTEQMKKVYRIWTDMNSCEDKCRKMVFKIAQSER